MTRRRVVIHGLTIVLVVAALASAAAHDPINSTVTWTGDIERIIHARCIGCHVEGGRGPMSLVRYEDARPWAKAIREEVLARRMPKWHAARGYGQFANDRSLTAFEIALVAAWVDGGAARGPKSTVPASPSAGGPTAETDVRRRTVGCGEQRIPRGRLLGVRPRLEEGGSAGISLLLPDGSREIVAWIRGFERKFEETYWLQDPLDLPAGTRLTVESSGRCRIELAFAR